MSNIFIVTTFWGKVSEEEGEARISHLKDEKLFGPYFDGGAQLRKYYDDKESAHQIISDILKTNNPLPVRIQKQVIDKRKRSANVNAFEGLQRIFQGQLKEFNKMMRYFQQERPGKNDIVAA